MNVTSFAQYNGIGIIVSFFILCITIIIPVAGRLILALLSLLLACILLFLVHKQQTFLNQFESYSFWPWYQEYITRPFLEQLPTSGLVLATLLTITGIGVLLPGKLNKIGCIAGILSMLLLAPLGIATFFPSTLLIAASFLTLLCRKIDYYGWQFSRKALSHS